MNKETEIMARMNALNNAAIAMQATLEKFEEPQNIEDVADKIIEIAREKFLKFILEPLEKEEDPFIMVYIDKGKYDPKDAKYKDFFEKHDFKKSKGGYYKRMKQSEYEKLIQDHDWITKSFKIKTEVARKQEEEK